MNPNPAGAAHRDSLAAAAVALVTAGVDGLLGPAGSRTVVGSVTWGDLATSLCFLLLTLAAYGVAVAGARRWSTRSRTPEEGGQGIRQQILHALAKPVYALIWIYGVDLALTPLAMAASDPRLTAVPTFREKLVDLGSFVLVFWLFFRLTCVLEARLELWASRTNSKLDDLFVPLLGRSLRVIVPVMGVIFGLPILALPADYAGVVAKGSGILLIVAFTVIAFQAVGTGEKVVLAKYDISAADNLRARKIYTQIHVISKVVYTLISLFATASILMMFEEVRRLGTSLLASAGVIGIIIGFAAQKTISNLFAGFQLAVTEPIRLDDVVVVEGEWGRIEEITLTYVVVHIWDDRRLIVPLSTFIEKPFQNWTRVSAELLGAVLIWVDYSAPLKEIRAFLRDLIEEHPLWDRRFWNLQVTDATDRTMQIRVLVTSADSSKGWNLRCDIRERLIAYIQQHHPQSLPRFRAQIGEVEPPATTAGTEDRRDGN
jgi:small-conductance mechanosensitive channel